MSLPAHWVENEEQDSFCSVLLSFPMYLILVTKVFRPGKIDINICVLAKPFKQFNDRYLVQELWDNCLIACHKQYDVVISVMGSAMRCTSLHVVVKVQNLIRHTKPSSWNIYLLLLCEVGFSKSHSLLLICLIEHSFSTCLPKDPQTKWRACL